MGELKKHRFPAGSGVVDHCTLLFRSSAFESGNRKIFHGQDLLYSKDIENSWELPKTCCNSACEIDNADRVGTANIA